MLPSCVTNNVHAIDVAFSPPSLIPSSPSPGTLSEYLPGNGYSDLRVTEGAQAHTSPATKPCSQRTAINRQIKA